jgi:hypothetical protein
MVLVCFMLPQLLLLDDDEDACMRARQRERESESERVADKQQHTERIAAAFVVLWRGTTTTTTTMTNERRTDRPTDGIRKHAESTPGTQQRLHNMHGQWQKKPPYQHNVALAYWMEHYNTLHDIIAVHDGSMAT